MKINGWQRLGLVASVAWAIGAFFYTRGKQVEFANSLYGSSMSLCYNRLPADMKACMDEATSQHEYLYANTSQFIEAFTVSLLPVMLAWILVPLGIKIFKWVKAGFSQ